MISDSLDLCTVVVEDHNKVSFLRTKAVSCTSQAQLKYVLQWHRRSCFLKHVLRSEKVVTCLQWFYFRHYKEECLCVPESV